VRPVLEASRGGAVRAAAHVTGGGLVENLPRALPDGLGARLDARAWARPPVYDLLARLGELDDRELASTFNVGLGMVLVADPRRADDVLGATRQHGVTATVVGEVVAGAGVTL
jgi:phosphoribosylformylglycinamidine cyclo-ligase